MESILMLAFTVACVVGCISYYKEKYVVENNYIEGVRLLKKKQVILYADISKVEVDYMQNAKVFVVYSKKAKKPIFKIYQHYKHGREFEELAYKMKWIK